MKAVVNRKKSCWQRIKALSVLYLRRRWRNVECVDSALQLGTTRGIMTNLFDHLHQHRKTMHDECKAWTKSNPRHMSVLDASDSCSADVKVSKRHVESTRKLNKCPSFSQCTEMYSMRVAFFFSCQNEATEVNCFKSLLFISYVDCTFSLTSLSSLASF